MEAIVNPKPYEAAAPIRELSWRRWLQIKLQIGFEIGTIVVKSIIITLFHLWKIIFPTRKDIRGQVALVTGGANGLGRGICLSLAKRGCNIAITDIDFEGAERTAAECQTLHNVRAVAYRLDVTDCKAVTASRSKIEEDLGPVDILVNNAGILMHQKILGGTSEEVQRTINVNLTSHLWTIRTFLEGMIQRRRGHIVAISSITGHIPFPRAVVYTATKHGVRGLMEALYAELCLDKLQHVIRTTTVYPYFINTNRVITEVANKFSSLNKLKIMKIEDVSETIAEAIQQNNRSLLIPRYLAPLIALQGLNVLEVKQMMRTTLIGKADE